MTINQLSEQRKILRQALIDGGLFEGFKRLLTDLYPDNAHFIYELLQNAEDTEASEVRFVLKADRCEFEHNGHKLFTIDDVESITNMGSSTKADDPTSIGKFGIGFKAVFAYTNTPEIESGPFHFCISDLIVPDTEGLLPGSLGERKTRFAFPFDNPKKPAETACAEIEKNLRQLNESTLLFLSNIQKIEYCLPDLTNGSLELREGTDNKQIEISVKSPEDIVSESTHYLRFTKDVDVQDEEGKSKCCRIAVAFGMDKSKGGESKIKSLNPGQVSIYFPAVKETSNLRFHLHAPFASTVARDSVRDCPANDELRDHLADLVAESMHTIRDQGLLNVEFLATLPNTRDSLSPFYLPIQERLIEEFEQEKLVPMKQGRHAPASGCYRGLRELSDLIKDKDLATLLGKDCSQPLWIANPQQINQPADNFLSMLSISRWTTEDLIKVLENQADMVTEWLKEKRDEWQWHQDLYVLLSDFLSSAPSSPFYIARERKEKLSNLCIVRCSDDEYRVGSECHFPNDDVKSEPQEENAQQEEFHYVAKGVYSSGQNKNQQKKARAFLEDIGVCEVDEAERIKVILRQRYEDPDTVIPSKLHEEDMKRFIALVEKEPDKASLFKKHCIFNTNGGDGCTVPLVFLDSPYLDTGLAAYYEDDKCDINFLEEYDCVYFSLDYKQSDIDLKRLGKFAEAVGAKTKLEAKEQIISENHPEWRTHLSQGSGRLTYTAIDEDYRTPEFQILLANPSIVKSKLFWQMMCSLPERVLKARFRWNRSNELREANSTLVHELRNAKWILQKNGDSISLVYPRDALRDHLPGGFPYDAGQKWLEAIEFGKTAEQRRSENNLKRYEQNVRNQRATEMGFNSANEANTMAEIANALKEQGKSPDELRDKTYCWKTAERTDPYRN